MAYLTTTSPPPHHHGPDDWKIKKQAKQMD
jgi:hypothetical protein